MTVATDDYPFRNMVPDSGGDGYGFLFRECTSFGHWRSLNDYGYDFELWGNANTWPPHARAAGLVVDGSPRVGDIAALPPYDINGAGKFGHIAIVLEVLQQAVRVEDYNFRSDYNYLNHIILSSGVSFIHLPQAVTMEDGMGASFVLPDNSQQARFWIDPGNGHIFEMWYVTAPPGKWNGPVDVTAAHFGNQALALGGLSASVAPDGAQLLFWRGRDGHQWEAWYVNGKWNGPVPLAGT